jgi:C1A family cysteine protease
LQWVSDKPDTRDYRYSITQKVSPNLVDLRPYCSPIENQGSLSSCTGQAIAGAIELLNKRNGKPTDVSRLFIYYYERLLLGTVDYDSGAYIRDGIKATNHYGASLESLWPHDIRKFKHEPITEAKNDALNRKVTRYERVTSFDGCIDALNNGYPVIMGFHVYTSFMSASVARTGVMPYPNTRREKLLGGHAVLLVGYDKRKKVFIARNSWGTLWGAKGYFYMPFNVVTNTSMSSDYWIIKSVNNP